MEWCYPHPLFLDSGFRNHLTCALAQMALRCQARETDGMPKKKRLRPEEDGGLLTADSEVEALDGETEELLPEGKLVCALTGEQKLATPQEETLQSFIEQLHREYGVALEDMGRDVRIRCTFVDERPAKNVTKAEPFRSSFMKPASRTNPITSSEPRSLHHRAPRLMQKRSEY